MQCNFLEWRIPVEFSRDEVALKELLSKADVHRINQTDLSLPEGDGGRLIAKRFLFRVIFRGTGWAFANDNDFKHVSSEPDYWDDRIIRFYSKYKGIDNLHKKWIEDVYTKKRIEVFTGRFWEFELKERKNFRSGMMEKVPPLNDLTNYPVQGTGNDLIAIARISLKNRLTKYNIPAIIVSTVHDSIVTDTPNKYVKDVVQINHDVFRDIPKNIKRLFNYEWIVPIPCETKVGPNLLDMEKYEYN
jgi:DNA polymerase I-like protein with 3'-5' exonuclease and polymerase domains